MYSTLFFAVVTVFFQEANVKNEPTLYFVRALVGLSALGISQATSMGCALDKRVAK